MKTKLTEKLLKSISPADKPFELIDDTLPGFLVRVQPSGCMTFYLSYRTSEGTRKRIKLGKYGPVTLVQAKELAKRHAGSVANGDDPQADKQALAQQSKKAETETLNGFIDAHYRPWVKKNRKSGDHTLMVLDKYFSNWGGLLMSDINKQRVEKWRLQELNRGLKPATINRILNALRSVLTQAVELGLLESSPLGRLKKLAEYDDKRIRYLTPEEEAKLLHALSSRNQQLIKARTSANSWRAERGYDLLPEFSIGQFADHISPIVLLALHTGMRRGELFHLRWEDVDLSKQSLTVRAANAKSGKARHIPLNNVARDAMNRWREGSGEPSVGLVFPSPDGKPMRSIKTAWAGLMKTAGINDFRFHDLRHNFASQLVMKGVHLITVQELLGHADMQMTLRYAHLDPTHTIAAVGRLAT